MSYKARIKFTLPDDEEIIVWCQRDEVEEIIDAVDSDFQVEVLYAEEEVENQEEEG